MRKLPLQVVAPALVVVLGLLAAMTVVFLGRSQIRKETDSEAQFRARVLSSTLASRMRYTPLEDREPLVREVANAANLDVVLVSSDGTAIVDESRGISESCPLLGLLIAGEGEAYHLQQRYRFATHPLGPPLEHLSVVVFVEAPSEPVESREFTRAVVALIVLLIGVAVVVTISYARAANDEVRYVGRRIFELADPPEEAGPGDEPRRDSLLVGRRTQAHEIAIPVRSFDEVGELTAAFNTLVERFAAAEKSYRSDLREAAQTDEDRLEFLAGLSHELRTPLNAILGFSHVLEAEVDGPLNDDARESIEVIRTSGEHLRTLIDDILDLSLLEVDQLRLSLGVVDLSRLSQDVVREASASARHKGLLLSVHADTPVLASADRRRVRQIVTNLVSNAIKFTSKGSVVVRVASCGEFGEGRAELQAILPSASRVASGAAVVWVEDTGFGIPAEHRVTVFEAYKQLAENHARHGGAGLGLATVKRLVELHGGAVWVEDAQPTGSRFAFTLPLATEAQRAESNDGRLTSIPPPVSRR